MIIGLGFRRMWGPICGGAEPSRASPSQACLHVTWRSHHLPVPAVRSVGLICWQQGRIHQHPPTPPLPLSSSPFPPLYLFHSLPLPAPPSPHAFFFFFFWPGRASQCEIMVNAPWQSDTTHSPGPAPSGFNLIWSERRVCVRRGGVVAGKKGWVLVGGWGGGWRTRWKRGVLFSAKSSHHPSFFLNCPLPPPHIKH